MEELTDRKIKILNALIKNYLDTGEPVGSRTISKYTDLNLSSATIRNEMSDLEELGYIVSPHTSAGRIPTDKGYRFYVNNLMEQKDKEVADMKEFVIEHTEKMENVLKQVVKLLANNTQLATMITAPSVSKNKLKFLQLSVVDDTHMLAVIVLDGNVIKNRMIEIDERPEDEILLKLNLLLNTNLNGLALDQINLGVVARMKEQAGDHATTVARVVDAIAEAIAEDEDLTIYTSGTTNIFKYPELSDTQMASRLISTFEEKTELANLVAEETDQDIQVYIGDETRISTMKDCSVLTTSYDLGDGLKGTIGIIGPKRMDYENAYDSLKTLRAQLDGIFGGKDEKR